MISHFVWCSLMKASHKMVSRCMYLNILLQTKSHDILNRYVLYNTGIHSATFHGLSMSLYQTKFIPLCRFIRVGGYKLLNSWLTYSKTTSNTPLLQLILLTLQKLPLTVEHLKQVALYSKCLLLTFREHTFNFFF